MVEVLEAEYQGKGDALTYEVQKEDEQGVTQDVCFLEVRYNREIENLDKVESQPIEVGY